MYTLPEVARCLRKKAVLNCLFWFDFFYFCVELDALLEAILCSKVHRNLF